MSLTRRTALNLLAAPALLTGWPTRAAGGLREVVLPVSSSSFGTAGPRVARELGLFERNGLSVRISVLDTASTGMAALLGGSALVVVAGAGELALANVRGQAVVAVASIYQGYSGTLVLDRSLAARSGISADAPVQQRLKALDGVLIATPGPLSGYTVATRAATDAAGAKPRFTYMGQPAMAAALETGAIQGMACGAPFWTTAVTRGSGVMWVSGPRGEMQPDTVPVSSASLQMLAGTARADPGLVRQLRQTQADLGTAIVERPAEVAAAVGRLFPDLSATSLELLLSVELQSLHTRPLTVDDIRHDLAYVRASGTPLPDLDAAKLLADT